MNPGILSLLSLCFCFPYPQRTYMADRTTECCRFPWMSPLRSFKAGRAIPGCDVDGGSRQMVVRDMI